MVLEVVVVVVLEGGGGASGGGISSSSKNNQLSEIRHRVMNFTEDITVGHNSFLYIG